MHSLVVDEQRLTEATEGVGWAIRVKAPYPDAVPEKSASRVGTSRDVGSRAALARREDEAEASR